MYLGHRNTLGLFSFQHGRAKVHKIGDKLSLSDFLGEMWYCMRHKLHHLSVQNECLKEKKLAKLKHDINTPHKIYGGIPLRLPHPLSEILKEIAFGATVVLMEVNSSDYKPGLCLRA